MIQKGSRLWLPLGLCFATIVSVIAHGAPAKATHPLVRPPNALKKLKLSSPISLEVVSEKKFSGLDLEEAGARKKILAQAEEYIALRRGRMSTADATKWLETCEASLGKPDINPYCAYEMERKAPVAKIKTAQSRSSELKRSLATDIREGRYDKLTGHPFSDAIGAVRQLEVQGHLSEVATKVASLEGCLPSNVPSALGYKLEEQFPEAASVDLTKKLYAKAVLCGKDHASVQAAFRLALIHIWQNKCSDAPDLLTQVETNPEGAMYRARAKYWQYHCAGINGNEAAKTAARNSLLREHPMSFQTLAVHGADDVSLAQIVKSEPPSAALRSVVRLDLNARIRAVEALIRLDVGGLASEMIEKSLRDFQSIEPEVRLYIATMLNRTGFALAKFRLLSDLFQDAPQMVSVATLKLFFPLWYYDMIKNKQKEVDPLLIVSLIRQESAFNIDAKSIAGARGLMQVMPATARMVASVRANKLLEPSTNIRVGTQYFLKRLSQFDGDVELTLAAYNAGHNRVDQWRKRYTTDNKMLFLDFIPFRETREYVSAILRNYFWYVKLYAPEMNTLQADRSKALAITSANAGSAAKLITSKARETVTPAAAAVPAPLPIAAPLDASFDASFDD